MTSRRSFLIGLGATTATHLLPAAAGASTTHDAATDPARLPRRAIHGQQPYYNFDNAGDAYTAPQSGGSTRDYCASLSHEEFLRRHWFC